MDGNGIPVKTCSTCQKTLPMADNFYFSKGKYRSECKPCTIARNTANARRTKAWKARYGNPEILKEKNRQYYADNKEKFAEYRQSFRNKYPGYFEHYYRNKSSPLRQKMPSAKVRKQPIKD